MTQIHKQRQNGQSISKQATPMAEDIQKPKVLPETLIDLGKGPVFPITIAPDRKTAYLLPWETCNIVLIQLRSDRSEDYDFLDQIEDLTKSKVFLGQRTIQVLKSFDELAKEKKVRFACRNH
jgi:hypothetical protein